VHTYTPAQVATIEAREDMADFLAMPADQQATKLAMWEAVDAREAAQDAARVENIRRFPPKPPVRSCVRWGK
jgi:hypothetical protein